MMQGRGLANFLCGLTFAVCSGQPAFAQSPITICPDVPDPVISLGFESRYTGETQTRTKVDPSAKKAAQAALRDVERLINTLSDVARQFHKAHNEHERRAHADCIVERLQPWARAQALSDLRTQTAQLTIGARLSGIALPVWQVRGETTQSPALAEVSQWLGILVDRQMIFWETGPSGAARGNLRAWDALAAATVGDLRNDPTTLAWARASGEYVVCTANPDGSLPREMERGRLALHYQLHAIAPLAVAAAILEPRGESFLTACDRALQRAVDFAISDLRDGAKTRAITGKDQSLFQPAAPLRGFQLAWLEAYLTLVDDAELEAVAQHWRPLIYSKLGGDQSVLWGGKQR